MDWVALGVGFGIGVLTASAVLISLSFLAARSALDEVGHLRRMPGPKRGKIKYALSEARRLHAQADALSDLIVEWMADLVLEDYEATVDHGSD